MDKAEELFDKGTYEDAFVLLNRAHTLKPCADTLLLYAELYYEIDALDYALQKCFEVKLISGGDMPPDIAGRVYTIMFKIYFFEGRYDLADRCFQNVKSLEDVDSDFGYDDDEIESIDAFLQYYGDDNGGFSVYDRAEENAERIIRDAFSRIAADDTAAAVRILKKDLEANGSVRQYNLLMMCYINQHRYKSAEILAEQMLKKEKTRLPGVLNMINIGIFKKDNALADRYTEELKKLKITGEDDLEKVIETLVLTNRHEAVEEYVLKLLEYRPYDMEQLYHYACALFNGGKKIEARRVYKKIHNIYGDTGRAQFFLRRGDDMNVYYNAPMPFEYFGLLSSEFEKASDASDAKTLLELPESRELLYLALTVDELKKKVLSYLLNFKDDAAAHEILKRFFLDINGDERVKEIAALGIMASETPFEFAVVSREACGSFSFDGRSSPTKSPVLNAAYILLLTRLLFSCDGAVKNAEEYGKYFIAIADRLEKTDAAEREKFGFPNGIAAAVFFKVNSFKKGDGEKIARLFGISSSSVRKFLKLIDGLFAKDMSKS
jgi:tetratricopeptide (TPR) repeat protein